MITFHILGEIDKKFFTFFFFGLFSSQEEIDVGNVCGSAFCFHLEKIYIFFFQWYELLLFFIFSFSHKKILIFDQD